MFKYIGSDIPHIYIGGTIIFVIIIIIFYIGTSVSMWKKNPKKRKFYILRNIIVTLFLFILFLGISIFSVWLFVSTGKEKVYVAKPTINKVILPPIDDESAKVKVGNRDHTHIVSVDGNPKVGDKVEIKLRLSSAKSSAIYDGDKQKATPKLGKHHYGVNESIIREIDTKLIKN